MADAVNAVDAVDRVSSDEAHRLATRLAWTAGVFSAFVCAVLLLQVGGRQAKDPLEAPAFLQLKERLAADPANEQIKEKIRELDLTLRKRYFRQRAFTRFGGFLLLGGLIVLLASARSATTVRRRLPHPPQAGSPVDPDEPAGTFGRFAVAVLGIACVLVVIALAVSFRSVLPGTEAELAAMLGQGVPGGSGDGDNVGGGAAVAGLPTAEEIAKNWPRFRGPGGLGISAFDNLPTTWDGASGEGILWKTPVPLPGHSSPVVWGNRVFLTGATPAKSEVYAFDADDGTLLWTAEPAGSPQRRAEKFEVPEGTGYAAPTAATDGRRVYAMFAAGDLVAVDFDGKIVWERNFGIPKNIYGHASSPVVWKDRLILQFDQGEAKQKLSRLLALDTATGKTVWQTKRPVPNSWPTPIVIEHAGRQQIITCASPWVIAYDPATGDELWRSKHLRQDVGPSPTFADGIVFVANEFPQLTAIRPDGSGDVTDSHELWFAEDGLPDTASPLATDKFVFLLASYGTLTCYNAKEGGKPVWEKDFDVAGFTSSPSLAGKYLYLFDIEGHALVVEPTEGDCKIVAESDLGEECLTSPAMLDGRIYIRGRKHLFCIGQQ